MLLRSLGRVCLCTRALSLSENRSSQWSTMSTTSRVWQVSKYCIKHVCRSAAGKRKKWSIAARNVRRLCEFSDSGELHSHLNTGTGGAGGNPGPALMMRFLLEPQNQGGSQTSHDYRTPACADAVGRRHATGHLTIAAFQCRDEGAHNNLCATDPRGYK